MKVYHSGKTKLRSNGLIALAHTAKLHLGHRASTFHACANIDNRDRCENIHITMPKVVI